MNANNRLLRAWRFPQLLTNEIQIIRERFRRFEYVLNVTSLLIHALLFVHVVGCFWFYVAFAEIQSNQSKKKKIVPSFFFWLSFFLSFRRKKEINPHCFLFFFRTKFHRFLLLFIHQMKRIDYARGREPA